MYRILFSLVTDISLPPSLSSYDSILPITSSVHSKQSPRSAKSSSYRLTYARFFASSGSNSGKSSTQE